MPKKAKHKPQANLPAANVGNQAPQQNQPQPNTNRRSTWSRLFAYGLGLVLMAILLDYIDSAYPEENDDVGLKAVDLDFNSVEQSLLVGNVHPGIFSFSSPVLRKHISAALAFADQRYSNGKTYALSDDAIALLKEKAPKFLRGVFANDAEYNQEFEKAVAAVQSIYELDQSILETNLCDVANGRATYQNLAKYLKQTPLQKRTAEELVRLIRGINAQLQAPCAKDIGFNKLATYVTTPISVSSIGALVYDEAKCLKYLSTFDPDLIAGYKKLLAASKKILPGLGLSLEYQIQAWGLISDPKTHDPDLKKFLDKYYSIINNGNNVSTYMLDIAKKIQGMLQQPNVDPYVVAAMIHQSIVRLHAFEDGNGRTARVVANAVLINFGRRPIIFSSNAEYSDQVTTHKQNPQAFAKYLKEMDSDYPKTLTYYRAMQDCVNTKDATECMQQIRQTKDDLLQCTAEVFERTCTSDRLACR